jgi:hypothetical protein
MNNSETLGSVSTLRLPRVGGRAQDVDPEAGHHLRAPVDNQIVAEGAVHLSRSQPEASCIR